MGHDLSPAQRAMLDTWERHTAAEFGSKSVDATMETMTADPVVNHVPVMTGGVGSAAVRAFYSTLFVPAQPADVELTPLTRTVGTDRIVDELVYRFTHTIEMPWMLPGIPPTGRRIEVALVVVVDFEGERISAERIYWDQASVLVQAGLFAAGRLPVTGVEATRKVLDPEREPSNQLVSRTRE